MTGFAVRPALPGDYEAVLDINRNVYAGLDYLPIYYHIYMQSPDCHSFVCTLDGKIVGFATLRVVDHGLTMISVAGRVDPSLNSQGVFGKLIVPAVQEVYRRVPTVRFVTHAGVGAKHFDRLKDAAKVGRAPEKVILKWNVLLFKNTSRELQMSTSEQENISRDAVAISIDRAREIFSDSTNTISLFPSGYIVSYQNWRPLRASYDVLIDVIRSHYTLVSFREQSRSKVKAASFSFTMRIPLGVRIDIYYYDVVPSPGLLMKHVIKHVKHAASVTNDDEEIHILVHFPMNHSIDLVKQHVKPFIGDSFLTSTIVQENGVVAEGPIAPPTLKAIAKL